jgi:hypothetical protein
MADKESGEDILRAILEKGSDKAKKAAADALTQQPPEAEVEKVKKRTKGLKRVIAAKIGNSKYYHDPLTGAIVDEQGQPAPKRIADQISKDKVSTTAKTSSRRAQSIPELAKLKKEILGLRKLNAKLKKELAGLIKKNNQTISSTSGAFELFQNALASYSTRNSELLDALHQQNFNFQEKVIELMTGVKSPTRSSGETKTNAPTSRPKKGKAPRFKKTQSKYQRRVAGMTAAQKKAHGDRVQSRAEHIAAIRLTANVGTVVKSGLVGAAGGVLAGGVIAALLGARKEPPKPDLDAMNARTLGPDGGNIPVQKGQTRVEQEAARTPAGTPTRQGGAASISEISQYIVSKASEMGVNPYLALGIAAGEGLNRNTIGHPTFGNRDARGYSFGPYQLYSASPDPTKIAPGGMAMEFLQKYNEPPNASNWRKQVDFSLEVMKRRGPAGLERGPWYAVRDRGGVANITNQGTQYARQQGITPGAIAPEDTAPAANAPGGAGGLGTPTGGAGGATPAAAATTGTPGQPAQTSLASLGNSDLQKYNTKDQSHIAGLKSGFAGKLGQFLAAAEQAGSPIKILSGYRSPERQAQLFQAAVAKYGSPEAARKWVAPPGRSNHGRGAAVDLQYSSGRAQAWAHQNAAKFGLYFRMAHEPWHIEPQGGSDGDMTPMPGAPNAQYASAPTTAVQGAQMANQSTERAIAQGTAPTGGRMIVMNNTETINNTRIINQSDSLPRGNRRNTGFNPLQVFADAFIGKANSRVF